MKKVCFYLFVFAAICLFCLFSCSKTGNLYDIIISATANDETLAQGKILNYGKIYQNNISDDTLSEYLGLKGYPEFKDKIEELVVYSTLSGDYAELAAMKLYSSSDITDGKQYFERRIKSTTRALNMSGQKGYSDSAYVKVYGNVVVLYMMQDNQRFENKIKKML